MTEITGLPKKDEGFSRLDKLLYTLCSMSNFEGIEVPQSRIEEYYHSLITTNTFNLPIPQSRVEHLLNLIIKGENLGVEVPQSRIEYLLYVLAELIPKEELPFVVTEASSRHERYLWYLIENGGMNLELLTIEFYESETIYNTKDAQVRECEIDGSTILSIEKTKIGTEEFNVITSMASIGTPSDTKMKIEDDVYKSAILSGQTLVNLLPSLDKFAYNGTNTSINSIQNSYKLSQDGTAEHVQSLLSNLVINKTYILIYEVTESTLQSESFVLVNTPEPNLVLTLPKNIGVNRVKFTQKVLTSSNHVFRFAISSLETQNGNYINVKNPMLIEYQEGMENWDIPYFTGMTSSKMPVLSSIGKNLCPNIFIESNKGRVHEGNGLIYKDGYLKPSVYVSDYLDIKGISHITYNRQWNLNQDGSNGTQSYAFYDKNKNFISGYYDQTILTVPSNAHYFRITIDSEQNFQLEQGSMATAYEPYKSNILSLPSDLVLRGIGDVKDTLNVNTGEVIERTNQIVNHTSINDTYRHALTNENYFVATFPKIFTGSVDNMWDNSVLVCDKIPTKRDAGNSFGIYTAVQTPLITVPIATIGGDSLELFKQWYANLSPSYVYKLATSTIKTVALSIVDQSGNALEKPIAYEKGHIMLSSNTINPSMKYSLWSSNTYTLSPLKSNNTYTTKSDGSNYILNNVTHSGLNELVTINTLANNKLYTDDSEFKIVYGMHLNEDLSKIHGFATTRSPVLKLEHEGTVNTHSTSNLSLRSVDDGVTEVYDTLNMKTQELIKRCAELVFDGTETNWIFFGDNTNTVGAYMKNIEGMKPDINVKSISNLAIGKGSDALLDEQGAYLRGDSKTLFIKVNKDRLASHDLVGIKQFLADEAAKGTPIRVCYELVEPQTMQVEIESSGDMLTYSDFTNVSVTVEEGSIKPKRVRIKVVTKNTDTLSDMDSLKLTQIDSNKKTQQQSDINIVSMVATSEAFEGSLGL